MRDLNRNPFYGVIKEFDHWVVLFRERQVTIGSVIIMSKELKNESLGDISAESWGEFGEVCRFVETTLKKTFRAEKFNYLALMMHDPEVHFHVIPRYSRVVEFDGESYIDPDWPDATKRIAMNLDSNTLNKIKNQIMKNATP